MPEKSKPSILHSFLAQQVRKMDNGEESAKAEFAEVLKMPQYTHLRGLVTELVSVDCSTFTVTFEACRGMPSRQLEQLATDIEKRLANQQAAPVSTEPSQQLATAV